jgi:gluconolactonase
MQVQKHNSTNMKTDLRSVVGIVLMMATAIALAVVAAFLSPFLAILHIIRKHHQQKKMKSVFVVAFIMATFEGVSQESRQLSVDKPFAVVDLKTLEGSAAVSAKWYVRPAEIREIGFKAPGGSLTDALWLYPTGMNVQTNIVYPQVHSEDFNSRFRSIMPTDLENRQGNGLNSFVWYKVDVEMPQSLGARSLEGSTAVFEIVVDDYSEVWVNGKQATSFGQSGEGLIAGYNTRNRVVLSNDVKSGEKFSIAVLAINGPLGDVPENYIWLRSAVIDFYADYPRASLPQDVGKIYVLDTQLNQIISPDTKVATVADGFQFTEGPVWHPDGFLLFSDPNTNNIYKYHPLTNNVSVFISHSGYAGVDIGEYRQPGSNGLAIDNEGRLLVCQHGNRRVIRHEKKGPVTVLADKVDGKRLNSPNDIVIKSDGTIYFTDPPYGLPAFYSDKRKELPYQGVFMIKDGTVRVVAKDCGGPNGIAFSPDEKYLYVTNWDIRDIHHTKTIWRYEVSTEGSLKNGHIFFNMNQTEDDEALDGVKTDAAGNLFVSGPGGIWIISPSAKLLGKIVMPLRPANMAWGDEDGNTLYMTAHSSVYRMRVLTGSKKIIKN